MISNNGGIRKTHGERMHPFVQTPLHKQQRVFPEKVRDGTRITAFEQSPLVLEHKPVHIRVGREDCGFSENVGGENGSEAGDPGVDEGFRVGGFVGGD